MFSGALFAIGAFFSLIFAVITLISFIKKQHTFIQFLLWETIFVGIFIVSIFPTLIDLIGELIGVQVRGLLVLAVGLLGVYSLLYDFSIRLADSDQKIRQLQQEIALLRYQFEYDIRPEDISGHEQ